MTRKPIPHRTMSEKGRMMNGAQLAGRPGKGAPSLLDPAVLEKLRHELNDDDGWLLFIHGFLAHLPRRMEKLRSGLANADYDLAMDAVLSLKISCQMVGAERLADMALHLQHTFIDYATINDMAPASPQMENLLVNMAACAQQTAHALRVEAKLETPDKGSR